MDFSIVVIVVVVVVTVVVFLERLVVLVCQCDQLGHGVVRESDEAAPGQDGKRGPASASASVGAAPGVSIY